MSTDHYQTLGVQRNASPDDIKLAYRKLAATHHPDRGGNTAKFQEIQNAYSVLSDSGKKNEYDNPRAESFNWGHQSGPPNMHDIFSQFFGGGHNPFDPFGQAQRQQRNRTINLQTSVSLEEAFHGKELTFNLTLPTGRAQMVNIKIPPGINNNTVLRISGLGDDTFPNLPRGDLHLTVNVEQHLEYTRDGDDLIKEIHVHCIDAMLGKKLTTTTIDGKSLEVNINPGIQHNQTLSVPGYGMPNMSNTAYRGRLLMTVKIIMPTTISDAQRELLKNYHQL